MVYRILGIFLFAGLIALAIFLFIRGPGVGVVEVKTMPLPAPVPIFQVLEPAAPQILLPVTPQTSETSGTSKAPDASSSNAAALSTSQSAQTTTVTKTPIGMSLADTLTILTDAQLNAELDDLSSLGISWIRIDVDWSEIQRDGPNSFDWSSIDRTVAAAHARNIKVLMLLTYTPQWARSSDCDSNRCPPSDPSLFATFAHAVVARYSSLGVHSWEIWNEPNDAAFWQPAADAQAYASLIEAAYPVIHAADPSATVISGGLAPEATGNGNIAPVSFLSQVYDAGAGSSFDAVGFHPYSFPTPPSYNVPWNAWQQMANTSPSARSVMIAHGDSSKKIWMTEYGAPTGGPGDVATMQDYDLMGNPDHVREDLQATLIADAVDLVQGYAWAGPLFIYSYQDIGTSWDTPENFYGIVRFDGSQKPAYAALKEAIASGQ